MKFSWSEICVLVALCFFSCRKDPGIDPAQLKAEMYEGVYKCSSHLYTASFLYPPYHEYSYPDVVVTADTGYISFLGVSFHVDSIADGAIQNTIVNNTYHQIKIGSDSIYYKWYSGGGGGFAEKWYYGKRYQ